MIIPYDVGPFGAYNNGHDKRQAINYIYGQNQYWTLTRLLAPFHWVEVHKVYFTTLNSH